MMTLRTNVVSPMLMDCLRKISTNKVFGDFYLVGGTALALQRGHRVSIDIDMFTNTLYGEMDTKEIKKALVEIFPYVENLERLDETMMVYSLFVGDNSDNCVKLDICYDDDPVFPLVEIEGIKMLSEKDIAAMKMNAITQDKQRKKDFWDIHDLLESYSIEQIVLFALKRYPWSLNLSKIIDGFKRLPQLNDFTEVRCLKGKYWEFIVEDLLEQIPNIEKLS
ncbi:MAG: nucleotidyl transferase AbiEii/AbiGii toxin family protein [Bacteroidales bacterium]|nr:nucleotidyl transferase AbiEii/AbiGii toxin family protein [Bacteroidales bacterium]